MDKKLADLTQNMIFEIDPSELDTIISVTDKGDPATIRDLIADTTRTPDSVRKMFGIAAATGGDRVLPVSQLNREQLVAVAIATLRASDSDTRYAGVAIKSLGLGS